MDEKSKRPGIFVKVWLPVVVLVSGLIGLWLYVDRPYLSNYERFMYRNTRALQSRSEVRRIEGARNLVAFYDYHLVTIEPELRNALEDEIPRVRLLAAICLLQIDESDSEASDVLVETLELEDPGIVSEYLGISSSIRFRYPEMAELVVNSAIRFSDSQDKYDRNLADRLLCELASCSAKLSNAKLLADHAVKLYQQGRAEVAFEMLRYMDPPVGDDAVELWIREYCDPDSKFKYDAAGPMYKHPHASLDYLDELLELLDSENPELRNRGYSVMFRFVHDSPELLTSRHREQILNALLAPHALANDEERSKLSWLAKNISELPIPVKD